MLIFFVLQTEDKHILDEVLRLLRFKAVVHIQTKYAAVIWPHSGNARLKQNLSSITWHRNVVCKCSVPSFCGGSSLWGDLSCPCCHCPTVVYFFLVKVRALPDYLFFFFYGTRGQVQDFTLARQTLLPLSYFPAPDYPFGQHILESFGKVVKEQ